MRCHSITYAYSGSPNGGLLYIWTSIQETFWGLPFCFATTATLCYLQTFDTPPLEPMSKNGPIVGAYHLLPAIAAL